MGRKSSSGGREDKSTTVGFYMNQQNRRQMPSSSLIQTELRNLQEGVQTLLLHTDESKTWSQTQVMTSHLSPVQLPPLDSSCLLNASIWTSHWCTISVFCSVSEKHYFPKACWHSSLPFSIYISVQIFLPWGKLPDIEARWSTLLWPPHAPLRAVTLFIIIDYLGKYLLNVRVFTRLQTP